MNTKLNKSYNPESVALAEVKKARIAWRNANPMDQQAVKESYAKLREAKINYSRVKRAMTK